MTNKGWSGESKRHALSAKGVKSGSKGKTYKPVKSVISKSLPKQTKDEMFEENWRDLSYKTEYMADTPRMLTAGRILSDVQELDAYERSAEGGNGYVENAIYQYSQCYNPNDSDEVEMLERFKKLRTLRGEARRVECNNIKRIIFSRDDEIEKEIKVGDKFVWYSCGNKHIDTVEKMVGHNIYTKYNRDDENKPFPIRVDFVERIIRE